MLPQFHPAVAGVLSDQPYDFEIVYVNDGSADSTLTIIKPDSVENGNTGKIIAHLENEGFRIVEWPDRAPGLAADADLRLSLAYAGAGGTATLEGLSDRGRQVVKPRAESHRLGALLQRSVQPLARFR